MTKKDRNLVVDERLFIAMGLTSLVLAGFYYAVELLIQGGFLAFLNSNQAVNAFDVSSKGWGILGFMLTTSGVASRLSPGHEEPVLVSEITTKVPFIHFYRPKLVLDQETTTDEPRPNRDELLAKIEELLAKIKELQHDLTERKDLNHELTDTVRDLVIITRILAVAYEDVATR
jgi:hypothetical protein